jgi:hypothetical protein
MNVSLTSTGTVPNLLAPSYVGGFACVGAACPFSCCHHWRIFVDKAAYEKQISLPDDELVAKIKEVVAPLPKDGDPIPTNNIYAVITHGDNGVCRLCTPEGWCEIQKKFGEDALSIVCRQFPRNALIFVSNKPIFLTSLSTACPEVIRLSCLQPEYLKLSELSLHVDDIRLAYGVTKLLGAVEQDNVISFLLYEIISGCAKVLSVPNKPLNTKLFALQSALLQVDTDFAPLTNPELTDILLSDSDVRAEHSAAASDIFSQVAQQVADGVFDRSLPITTPEMIVKFDAMLNSIITDIAKQVANNDVDFWNNVAMRVAKSNFGANHYLEKFLNEREYVITNLLLNEIFMYGLPLFFPNGVALETASELLTASSGFGLLAAQYALLKTLFAAVAVDGEITDYKATELIVQYSRVFLHGNGSNVLFAACDNIGALSADGINCMLR